MFSANHRQHLLVAFRELDESLAEIRGCLRAGTGERLFPPYAGTVDPALRRRADALVADVRAMIAAFVSAQDLQSPPSAVPTTRAASARASIAMVAALELDPQHLRGYGELSKDESAALEALSQRLGDRLAQLVALLDGPASDDGPRDRPGSAR